MKGMRWKMDGELKSKTILVVEDVDEISSRMRAILREKGHDILSATNAGEAIQIAENNPPAMILTDLDLPTFDALVQQVRSHKDLNSIPIAIIDINHPNVNAEHRLNVLSDFSQLDALLASFWPRNQD
jgi:CheY-like chemotaxis protein